MGKTRAHGFPLPPPPPLRPRLSSLPTSGARNARFAIATSPAVPAANAQVFRTADFATFEAALAAYLGRLTAPVPATIAIGARPGR